MNGPAPDRPFYDASARRLNDLMGWGNLVKPEHIEKTLARMYSGADLTHDLILTPHFVNSSRTHPNTCIYLWCCVDHVQHRIAEVYPNVDPPEVRFVKSKPSAFELPPVQKERLRRAGPHTDILDI